MLSIEEIMKMTGYSRSQLQRRLALLRPLLNGGLRKGPKNKIFLDPQAVELICKLQELEAQGLRPSDAVLRLTAETSEKQRKALATPAKTTDRDPLLWAILALGIVEVGLLVAIAVALWTR